MHREKEKEKYKKKASGRDVYWLHRRNESINDILYIYPRNQDVHHPAAGWLRATCGAFERFTCSADINGYRYITNRHWRRNNGSHVVWQLARVYRPTHTHIHGRSIVAAAASSPISLFTHSRFLSYNVWFLFLLFPTSTKLNKDWWVDVLRYRLLGCCCVGSLCRLVSGYSVVAHGGGTNQGKNRDSNKGHIQSRFPNRLVLLPPFLLS